MPEREQEGPARIVTGIHLDLVTRSMTLDVDGQTSLTLHLTPYGLTFEGDVPLPGSIDASTGEQPMDDAQRTVTLTGRLKANPRPGRADRNGNPTAFARFSAHVEGEDQAHDYVCTFHRHTAPIALRLRNADQITIEGYPHPSGTPQRLDTFSVINIPSYPARQPQDQRRGSPSRG